MLPSWTIHQDTKSACHIFISLVPCVLPTVSLLAPTVGDGIRERSTFPVMTSTLE